MYLPQLGSTTADFLHTMAISHGDPAIRGLGVKDSPGELSAIVAVRDTGTSEATRGSILRQGGRPGGHL